MNAAASLPRCSAAAGPAAGVPPSAGGGLLHQFVDRNANGVRDEQQVVQVGHALPVLPAVNRPVVAADEFAEPDLSQVGRDAGGSDPIPDLPAPSEDPGGFGIEWHPPTLYRSWCVVFA